MFSYGLHTKVRGVDHLRVDGSGVTITLYRAHTQDFSVGGTKIGEIPIPNAEDTPPETLQVKLFGEYM